MDSKGFDVWAQGYDASVRESDERDTYPFAGYTRVLGRIYDAVMENGGGCVLDLGIGTGVLSGRLYDEGCQVTGLDFSERMIELARARMPAATLIRHDFAEGLPRALEGQRFDAVVSTYAMHHVPDARKVELLRALFGLLAPGGVLLVGDIGFETAKAREAGAATYDGFDPSEFYSAYDELRPLLTVPSAYAQLSHCAGVLRLKKPRLVLFDYGGTLVETEPWDTLRATRAVMPYLTENPRGLTAEQISAVNDELFEGLTAARMEQHVEVHEAMFLRFLHEYLQLKFSIPWQEIERVFMRAGAERRPAGGIEALLSCLSSQGIRTAVLSNIMYSGAALEALIESLLPGHAFEFAIATSEYIHRKPSPLIFELALRKADLPAGEVWHCGDLFDRDITGAAGVGIEPIWYARKADAPIPGVPFTHVPQWHQLTAWMDCTKMNA